MQSSRLLSPVGVSQDVNNIVTSPLTYQDPNDLLFGDMHFVRGQSGTTGVFICNLVTSFPNENLWMLFTEWLFYEWPGIFQWYSDSLRAGRSGDRIPVGARFSAPVQTGPAAHPASNTMGIGYFQGVKRPGRCVDHPPPSSTEVKERVELYLYSPSGLSWPVLRWILPLLFKWLFCIKITLVTAAVIPFI